MRSTEINNTACQVGICSGQFDEFTLSKVTSTNYLKVFQGNSGTGGFYDRTIATFRSNGRRIFVSIDGDAICGDGHRCEVDGFHQLVGAGRSDRECPVGRKESM